MTQHSVARGLRTFILIASGELVSIIGSNLSGFALGVWVYQRTGSVTYLALIYISTTLPMMAASPLSGVLVDRWDRRRVLIFSDTGAAFCTLFMALLLFTGRLQVWHICLASAVQSTFGSLQWPAFSATTPLLVPHQHLARVNGVVQGGFAVAQIVSPALAGLLVVTIQLRGVLLIDFITFFVAVAALLLVRIPRPEATAEGQAGKGSLSREMAHGWIYIAARPGLLGLLVFFAAANFLVGAVSVLTTPLVLAFASVQALGALTSTGGLGMLVGSLVMGIWGGPKRRIYGVLGFMSLAGLFIALGGLRPSVPLLALAAFGFFLSHPIVGGCSQAIWQSKVAPDMQGRVLATTMLAGAMLPVGYLVAGPLADYVFEPLLAAGGPLAASVGRVIGSGAGRGIGLMYIVFGILTMLVAALGYVLPRIRQLDAELPDMVLTGAPTEDKERGSALPAHV